MGSRAEGKGKVGKAVTRAVGHYLMLKGKVHKYGARRLKGANTGVPTETKFLWGKNPL